MKNIKWIIGVLILIFLAIGLLGDIPENKTQEAPILKVAAILPLTGPAASPGEEALDGMLLALEEINADVQLIELLVEDSETKPAEGVAAVNKLEINEKPDIYITATSAVSMAVAPLAEQFSFLQFGIFTYAPDFVEQNDNTFRFFAQSKTEAPVVYENIKNLAAKRVGILHLNTDYGNSLNELLIAKLKSDNIPVFSQSFLAPDQDMKSQLLKLKSFDVDAIYVVGYDSHVVNGIKQAREIGYTGNLLASIALPQPRSLDLLSLEHSSGVRSAYPKISEDFKQKFFDKYGYKAGGYAPNAYALMYLIADELVASGNYSTESFLETLNNLPSTYTSVLGNLYPDGQEIPFELYPVEIQNGKVIYK